MLQVDHPPLLPAGALMPALAILIWILCFMLQAGAEYIRQRPVDAALSEVAKTVQSSRPLTAPPVQPVTSGARPSAPSARSTVAGGALRITPATEVGKIA